MPCPKARSSASTACMNIIRIKITNLIQFKPAGNWTLSIQQRNRKTISNIEYRHKELLEPKLRTVQLRT